MAARQLFPQLPAELRNEVYSHLSTTTAVTYSIPLKLKTYVTSHATVQLCVVHHGSTSLLTLHKYGFLEGSEYLNHLVTQGAQVWISVHFTGHVNTFVQKHWDAKMAVSLRKLAGRFPWLANVATYQVKVYWEPKTDSMARAAGGISGRIVNGMVETLLGLQNAEVRTKKGDVRVELHVGPSTQLQCWLRGVHLGLDIFLSGTEADTRRHPTAATETRSVTAPNTSTAGPRKDSPGACVGPQRRFVDVHVPARLPTALIIISDHGRVSWDPTIDGKLILRRTLKQENMWMETDMALFEGEDDTTKRVWSRLWEECGCGVVVYGLGRTMEMGLTDRIERMEISL